MSHPRHICIFLSSPGDVADERSLALQVIDQLPYDPLLRGKVTFEVVAWDKPGAGTPMLATMTPQEAINEGLPKPSECDIVVVLFWARMGTPLPEEYAKPDGNRYWSGTEWEYLDAFNAAKVGGKPLLVVYRRMEKVLLDDDAADFEQRLEQKRRVKAFFDTFTNPDGSIRGGYNTYEKPDDFREQFESHLESLILRLLEAPLVVGKPETAKLVALWKGSPFPGLRAFTPADAPIFFGRGRETDTLVQRVNDSQFVAVVGASGSGKSSLVGAGLLPRLKGNAIAGSKDWLLPDFEPGRGWSGLRFTPGELGDNPFMALAAKLAPLTGDMPRELAARWERTPDAVIAAINRVLAEQPDWVEVLLFIDQFEELFTVVGEQYRQAFVELLVAAANSDRLRVVVTMRSDFYHRCVDVPLLVGLLEKGSYPLGVPDAFALLEMIERPAERAGLTFESDLAREIVRDTGSEPGALALLAYALDELYHTRKEGVLTAVAYEALGRVSGAIGRRAESMFGLLDADAQAALPQVFRELVEVDERGTATRQRAKLERVTSEAAAGRLVTAFIGARLLTTSRVDGGAVVEVAHEALFRSWELLKGWIGEAQEDLILLRQVRNAAQEWDEQQRLDYLLWPQERLKLVSAMQARLKPEWNAVERDFIEPEQYRLLWELERLPATAESHERRRDIGDRLAVIGDTRPGVGVKEGVPDIVWLSVAPGGEIIIENQRFPVQPFYIAKYLMAYAQFRAFLDAPDGFENDEWWNEMPDEYKKQVVPQQRTKIANAPRDSVSWYQAVAFTRWLNYRLNGLALAHPSGMLRVGENAEIRLPLEWEWQWAAQGGVEARQYPWGEWQEGYANTSEAGLGRTTAVGMYPRDAAQCGALDMAGNLWEWCLNDYENIRTINCTDNKYKVLRGGSFFRYHDRAACAFRRYYDPFLDNYNFGLRVVLATPIG